MIFLCGHVEWRDIVLHAEQKLGKPAQYFIFQAIPVYFRGKTTIFQGSWLEIPQYLGRNILSKINNFFLG